MTRKVEIEHLKFQEVKFEIRKTTFNNIRFVIDGKSYILSIHIRKNFVFPSMFVKHGISQYNKTKELENQATLKCPLCNSKIGNCQILTEHVDKLLEILLKHPSVRLRVLTYKQRKRNDN